jgi:hypothetical protein
LLIIALVSSSRCYKETNHPWAVWMYFGSLTTPPGSWGNVFRKVIIPWVCILNLLFWDIEVSQLKESD